MSSQDISRKAHISFYCSSVVNSRFDESDGDGTEKPLVWRCAVRFAVRTDRLVWFTETYYWRVDVIERNCSDIAAHVHTFSSVSTASA